MQTSDKKKMTYGEVRALIQKGGRKKCWYCAKCMSRAAFAQHMCEERLLFFAEKRLRLAGSAPTIDKHHSGPASNHYNAVVYALMEQYRFRRLFQTNTRRQTSQPATATVTTTCY